jgi:pyridoxamine 5'-phosphate oxidase
MSARLESLPAVEAALWHELQAAAHDKRHPWRAPVLATTDGEVGDARTVILREVNAEQATLLMYSDARASKVAQIAAHPHGTLVMWSPALGWQLRLRVHLHTVTDGLLLSSRWAQLKLSPAANDYLSSQAPGDMIDNALGARGERAYFALLEARVLSIDWLELHAQGHRRARFSNDATPCWLQP